MGDRCGWLVLPRIQRDAVAVGQGGAFGAPSAVIYR